MKQKNLIIDKRIQQRKITINFTLTGYEYSLDEIIDQILPDLKTVIEQRENYGVKIEIILE